MKPKWKTCRKGVKGCPMEEPDARKCPFGYVWVDEHDDFILNCISTTEKPFCLLEEKREKEKENARD